MKHFFSIFLLLLPCIRSYPLDLEIERDVLSKLYNIQKNISEVITIIEDNIFSKEIFPPPCFLDFLDQAQIINVRYNKSLKPGPLTTTHDQDRRNVFLDRGDYTEMQGTDQWVFTTIEGTNSHFRIKNLETNELLYAAFENHNRSPERRRVFTWMNTTTTPESHPSYWTQQADWEISCGENGYTIKNLEFGEYLYAAADDWAFDDMRRSIFTWKTYHDLGNEGYWNFKKIEKP